MTADGSDRSREVRLGLVLYGGVSLAIYINGVTREFFEAVRGRGVYRLLKALTDSDIVVDIVSGTSAGGINGIFLAYALCNEREFASTAEIWRKHGSLDKLLRDPLRAREDAASLLNGELYYQVRLVEAFAAMPAIDRRDEAPSPLPELDLFITGTDVHGRLYTRFDDAGHPIDVKDHRTVFQLKHREGRKEPFNPEFPVATPEAKAATHEALAKLARLTSTFPGAFEPVVVPEGGRDDSSVDGRLRLWGRLGDRAYFVDGGVLDNKPFTHTLGEIFARIADREVDRKLLFVEPDPETLAKLRQVQGSGTSPPGFGEVIVAALVGIPGYESINQDLRQLAERNDRLEQYKRLRQDLERSPAAIGAGADVLHRRARLITLCNRVVDGLLRGGGRAELIRPEERQRVAELIATFDRAIKESDDPSIDRLLEQADIYFALRRIFRLTYVVPEVIRDIELGGTGEPADRYRPLLRQINRQVKLYQIVVAAMEALVDENPIGWQRLAREDGSADPARCAMVWLEVQAAIACLLADDPALQAILPPDLVPDAEGTWLAQPVLNELNRLLAERKKAILAALAEGRMPEPEAASMLPRLAGYETMLLDRAGLAADDPVRIAYDRFADLDRQLYPIELMGGLREKDTIETVRISPLDAQRGFSNRGLSDKIAGDSLYHFGAFLKGSWRANDILWGRLDGCCQLIETLLDRARLDRIAASPSLRRKVLDALAAPDLDPAMLFPQAGAQVQGELGALLPQLVDTDPKARADAHGEVLDLLVGAAQLEIVHDDFPTVLADALQDQVRWNQYLTPLAAAVARKEAASTAGPGAAAEVDPHAVWAFQPGRGFTDRLAKNIEALALARETIDARIDPPRRDLAASPMATPLGAFFRDTCNVGAEELTRDIPRSALLEILASALLILRSCLLGMLGEVGRRRIESSLLYRWVLNPFLRLFHWTATGLRTGPRRLIQLCWGGILAALASLLLGIVAGSAVIVFLVAPALLFLGIGAGWLHGWVEPLAPPSRAQRLRQTLARLGGRLRGIAPILLVLLLLLLLLGWDGLDHAAGTAWSRIRALGAWWRS